MEPIRGDEEDVRGGDSIALFGPFRFDRRALLLSRGGKDLPVPPKPLALLRCLIDRPGEVLLKQELLDIVWKDAAVTENSLAEAVRALRAALDDDPRSPKYIETIHGRGYRFVAAVRAPGREPVVTSHDGEPTGAQPGDRDRSPERPADTLPALFGGGPAAAVALVALGLAAAAVWVAVLSAVREPQREVTRLNLILPDESPARVSQNVPSFAISSDGRRILYQSEGLWVRDLEAGQPRGVAQGGTGATFSPDDLEIASLVVLPPGHSPDPRVRFGGPEGSHQTFALERTPIGGGMPSRLTTARGVPSGLAWSSDGTMVYGSSNDPGLWVLRSGSGAEPTLIADSPGWFYVNPHLLPDGTTVIADARTCVPEFHPRCFASESGAQIVALSLDSGQHKVLLAGGGRARFVASGHLVVGRDHQLLAAPFDPDT